MEIIWNSYRTGQEGFSFWMYVRLVVGYPEGTEDWRRWEWGLVMNALCAMGSGVIFSQQFFVYLWLPSRSCRGLPTEKVKNVS